MGRLEDFHFPVVTFSCFIVVVVFHSAGVRQKVIYTSTLLVSLCVLEKIELRPGVARPGGVVCGSGCRFLFESSR